MTQEIRVLVADDDATVLANCMKFFMLDLPLAKFASAHSPSECRSLIRTEKFNVILLDISFDNSPITGLSLLPEIRKLQPHAKIFMLSSRDDEKTVLQAMNLGAADFISKSTNEFSNIAATVRSHIEGEAKNLKDIADGTAIAATLGIAFSSPLMSNVFAKVAIARRSRTIPVLITGETGAGKDIIAKAIAQGDNDQPAITLDCGAIPEALAESEFFGHMRGSFTGADANKIGKFQLAEGGSLFLDEIGNLKRGTQEKLLRVLQTMEITPVGGSKPQKVNVRILSATNEDLDEMVADGRFRRDLLERLRGIWIEIPALRDRPEDIPLTAASIISLIGGPDYQIAPTCLSLLCGYSWPGNVRELENVIREMLSVAQPGALTVRHLPGHFRDRVSAELQLAEQIPAEQEVPGLYNISLDCSFEDAKSKFIGKYISDRMAKLGPKGSLRSLAKELKIARRTLDTYIDKLGVRLGRDRI